MKYIKKIKPFHIDSRGEMSYLLDKETNITSALLITCKKGAIRANHYHKKDIHYSFLIKGEMEYYYKDVHSKNKPHKLIVREGEIVQTPANTIHAMKFTKNSVFIALTTEPREQKEYEKDTVRVKLIDDA